jgi:hypothetical protein
MTAPQESSYTPAAMFASAAYCPASETATWSCGGEVRVDLSSMMDQLTLSGRQLIAMLSLASMYMEAAEMVQSPNIVRQEPPPLVPAIKLNPRPRRRVCRL